MDYPRTLDIRDLANEWRIALYDLTTVEDNAEVEAIREECQKYELLCDELEVDRTPDDLEYFGDNIEPVMVLESDFTIFARAWFDSDNQQWPLYCIDWEYAARELAHDYSTIKYDGDYYKIRSW